MLSSSYYHLYLNLQKPNKLRAQFLLGIHLYTVIHTHHIREVQRILSWWSNVRLSVTISPALCDRDGHHFSKRFLASCKSVFWSYNLLDGNLKKHFKSLVTSLNAWGSETPCCNCQLFLHSFALLSVPCTFPPLAHHSNVKVLLGPGRYIYINWKCACSWGIKN